MYESRHGKPLAMLCVMNQESFSWGLNDKWEQKSIQENEKAVCAAEHGETCRGYFGKGISVLGNYYYHKQSNSLSSIHSQHFFLTWDYR
jgi:hypothetical protein